MLSYLNFKFLKSISLAICLFVLFLAFITLDAAAKTYYISPAGNDTKGDGSIKDPWKTLKKAHGNMSAGDTLLCRSGNYIGQTQFSWTVTGTKANPITIKNYPGENPKFLNIGYGGYLMSIRGSDWFTIDGLEIEGYFSALYIRGTPYKPDPSPVTDFAENVTIKNCYIHDTGEHGIYVSSGCKNMKIYNNFIENSAHVCIQHYHGPAPDGLDIYNNLLIGGTLAFAIGNNFGPNPTGIRIFNNVIYNQSVGGIGLYGSDSDTLILKNNIIYEPKNGVECIWGAYTKAKQVQNLDTDYNLYYKTGTGNFADVAGVTYATLADWQSSTGHDTNSLLGDPKFINPAAMDFHLQVSSPAIDMGLAAGAPLTDYEGTTRPQNGLFDIGAYEYHDNGGQPNLSKTKNFIIRSKDF